MITKITGEQPFQVLSDTFSISPSNEGYTLQVSADGENYSDLFNVGANTTKMCTGMANGSYYRLKNNESEVTINWQRVCKGEGGSGGSGAQGPAGPAGPQGPQGAGGDPEEIQDMIDTSILAFGAELEEGDPIVGMAKQLYSPDGVTVDGAYIYRTTGGDKDVSTGVAELRKLEAYSVYPEKQYNDSATLTRGGEEVEGFEATFEWGNNEEWNEWTTGVTWNEQQIQKCRMTAPYNISNFSWNYKYADSYEYIQDYPNLTQGSYFRFNMVNGQMTNLERVSAVTENTFIWGQEEVNGTLVREGDVFTATITGGTKASCFAYLQNGNDMEYATGANIPNDIPLGESTYTYSDSAWTPSMPQAVASMTLNSDPYEPEDGDEITITRSAYAEEQARHSFPEKFVALGLNNFDKDVNERPEGWVSLTQLEDNGDDTYTVTINAITDLNDGYVIYSETSAITEVTMMNDDGATLEDYGIEDKVISGETVSIAYPYTADEALGIFHYLRITTTDIDTLCVHPKWSGYRDEDYEPYTESVVDLYDMVGEGDGEYLEGEFHPRDLMWSVGNVRNTVDLEHNTFTMNVKQSEYSQEAIEQLVEDGKVFGVDFDFDDSSIYEVMDEPMVYNNLSGITTYKYTANDFSVEYWVSIDNQTMAENKIGCENYYMNNLVDKLRNLEGLVHLDTLNGYTGKENTLYECNGQLFYWDNNAGKVLEWTAGPTGNTFASSNGYGCKFSCIPNGQALFEFRYNNSSSAWRKVYIENDVLTIREADETLVASAATGTTTRVNCQGSTSRYIMLKYENNYLGLNVYTSVIFQNIWNGVVNGGHFVCVDKSNKPFTNIDGNTTYGIPHWNTDGQIVAKYSDIAKRNVYVNATGTPSNRKSEFIVGTTNTFPQNIFVPTTSGNQGQVLTSNGNAEPVWSSWIKSVQITSDAYDALVQAGTTDPNTLYLIVDE